MRCGDENDGRKGHPPLWAFRNALQTPGWAHTSEAEGKQALGGRTQLQHTGLDPGLPIAVPSAGRSS